LHHLKKEITISLVLFASFFLSTIGNSAPVIQRDTALTQADGKKFLARPFGDEWHNGYETEDGFTVLFDKRTGNWVYADRAEDGSLIKTDIEVGKGMPTIHKHLRPILREEIEQLKSQGIDLEEGPVVPATGNQKVLVILVQFTDRALMTTEAQWADLIFDGTTFSKLRHYFKQASYNYTDFIPASESYGTPDNGVVVVSLPYNHPNTAGNIDDRNRQITRDALIASDPYVDFASFDTDGNGYISTNELHIVIVAAGYEAAYGGAGAACSPSVWSHNWCLFEVNPLTLDGKKVAQCVSSGAYTQHGEWHCASWDNPGHMATIGVIAHELGHSLGLPDEYDGDGSSNGIGKWGLMGNGSWNSCSGGLYGNCPSHPTAWDKWYLNWLTPSQVMGTQTVDIPDITTSAVVYQLRDNPFGVDWSFQVTSGVGEYFLVENRQRTGYNAGLPGSGLLIWHIWEGVTSSNSANQNEAGRRLIDLREADGLNDLDAKVNSGDAGDPYPGSSNNTVFDDTSNPSSKLYCSSGIGFCDESYVSVTNISASRSTMTATLSDETTPPTGSISINSGATYANSTSVTLALTCIGGGSGCAQMQFSNDNISWSPPVTYATTKAWSLTSGDGTKIVYVKFEDNTGNWSSVYSDAIVLDMTAPTTTVTPPGGMYTSAQNVTLTCNDSAGSGCDKIYYTTDGSNPTTNSHIYSGSGSISASMTLKFFATDVAGNQETVNTEEYTITTRFEENDPAISYTGTWNPYYHSSCSGGALLYSCQTGAKASFSFTGTGIKWIVTKESRLGKARACLDGNCLSQLVDLYSAVASYQIVLQKIGLTPGPHTVTIEVSGQKNPSSKNYCVDIDAFDVVP
jgi:M6 family metalloprotease-like protein